MRSNPCVSVHLQERHGENFNGYLCEEISARQIPALETREGYIHHWSHKAHSRIHPGSKSMAAEEEESKSIQEVTIPPPAYPTCTYTVKMGHHVIFSKTICFAKNLFPLSLWSLLLKIWGKIFLILEKYNKWIIIIIILCLGIYWSCYTWQVEQY